LTCDIALVALRLLKMQQFQMFWKASLVNKKILMN